MEKKELSGIVFIFVVLKEISNLDDERERTCIQIKFNG